MNYKKRPIGELCDIVRENIMPEKSTIYSLYSFPAFDAGRKPVETMGADIKSSKLKVLPDTILFNKLNVHFRRVWNVGSSVFKDSISSTEFIPLKARDNVDKDFLYYYLTSDEITNVMFALRRGTSNSQQRIDANALMNYDLFVPPYSVQKKISYILNLFDYKIKLNNKIKKNLEEQAFALFDDFFPNICEGAKTVGDYITPKRGKNLLSKDAVLGEVPVVAGGLEPSIYHNTANTSAPVLTISASGANAGFVNLWSTSVWSSDSSYIDSTMTSDVFFWYVLLKKRQKEIFDAQTGSAQPHIYPQHIAALPINNVQQPLITKFTKQVTPYFELIGSHNRENNKLEALRNALLPHLMSGDLDVSNIDL